MSNSYECYGLYLAFKEPSLVYDLSLQHYSLREKKWIISVLGKKKVTHYPESYRNKIVVV